MTQHACALEVTYCDKCQDELETGQVGCCDSCRTYTFDELSDEAKDEARDAERYSEGYLEHEWWKGVYQDANYFAKRLGLDIGQTVARRYGKGAYTHVNINFSGFSSQGDGACFTGRYEYNPKAIEEVTAECDDAELIRIATALTSMQLTQRLLGREYFGATIKTSGNYSHSHSMNCDVDDWGIDEIGEVDEIGFAQLMRDFADWIYERLEDEHDHLMSDEVVDGYLEDKVFDESGVEV